MPRTGRFKSAGGEGSSFLPAVACRVERFENCVLVPSFSRASFLRLFVGGQLLWCALSTVRWFSGWPALCCERRKLRLLPRPACAGRPFSSPRALSAPAGRGCALLRVFAIAIQGYRSLFCSHTTSRCIRKLSLGPACLFPGVFVCFLELPDAKCVCVCVCVCV